MDANREPMNSTQNVRCPCCGSADTLKPYQTRLNISNRSVKIEICADCTTIVDRTNLDDALLNPNASLEYQANSSKEFYDIEQLLARLPAEMDANRGIVRFMVDMSDALGRPIPRKCVVDLGAGLGVLAAAACDYFEESWAVEINRWTLDQVAPHFNQPKLHVASSLAEVPGEVDAIMMWHTLEHIPTAYLLGQEVSDRLRPGGIFFWQVPMYRDPYVIESHYAFFNQHAAGIFFEKIGMQICGVWHDEQNQFLTCMAYKPAKPTGLRRYVPLSLKKLARKVIPQPVLDLIPR